MPDTTPTGRAMTMREIRDRLGHVQPGTTDQQPVTAPAGTELRDRIRRAICEASGFTWLPDDLMEPDEYGEHADAVLAVLPAPTDRAAAVQPADRRDRWEHAAWAAGRTVDRNALAAYMAVADTEQAALRAEVKRLRTDRATDRCGSCEHETRYHDVDGRCWFTVQQGVADRDAVCACQLRRLADEAQQPETEAAK